jgi:hypothetical protein
MKSRSAADSRKVWALIRILALFILAAGIAGIMLARAEGDRNSHAKYAIGLWGDLPYSDVQALTGVPNLIADMNTRISL